MRCTANTREGRQCKRNAKENGEECDQHQGLKKWREQQALLNSYKEDPPMIGLLKLVRLRQYQGYWGVPISCYHNDHLEYSVRVGPTLPIRCWDKGLRLDQRIINVNGKDVKGMSYEDVVALISGVTEDILYLIVLLPPDGHGYHTQQDVARKQWVEKARLAAERRNERRARLQETARRVVAGVHQEELQLAQQRKSGLPRLEAWRGYRVDDVERRKLSDKAKLDDKQQQQWIREAEERAKVAARKRRSEQCWGWLKWGKRRGCEERTAQVKAATPPKKRAGTGVLEPLLSIVENPMFTHDHQD
jgi:hypothetical protein